MPRDPVLRFLLVGSFVLVAIVFVLVLGIGEGWWH
jgi:hypothetical protein